MNCPLCGCLHCPREKKCTRQPQPETEFLPCPSCGCLGTWRFSLKASPAMRTVEGNGFLKSSYQEAIVEGEEKREWNRTMNIGAYVAPQQDQLPLLSASTVKNGLAAKVIAVREIKTPNFKGLIFEVKASGKKFAHLERYEPGYGISAAAAQMGTEETDDWVGENLKFITKKGSKGNKKFVNIAFPAKKKGKK